MGTNIIGPAIYIISLFTGFAIIRFIIARVSVKVRRDPTNISAKSTSHHGGTLSAIYLILATVIAISVGVGAHSAQLRYLNGVQPSGTVHLLPISWAAFLLSGVILGIALAGDFMQLVLIFWQDHFSNIIPLPFSFDRGKVIARIFMIATFIALFLSFPIVILGFDNYSFITDQKIIESPLLSFGQEQTHGFHDIHKILYITSSKGRFGINYAVKYPYYRVIFSDGGAWEARNFELPKNVSEKDIMTLLSQKSGITITEGVLNVDDQ